MFGSFGNVHVPLPVSETSAIFALIHLITDADACKARLEALAASSNEAKGRWDALDKEGANISAYRQSLADLAVKLGSFGRAGCPRTGFGPT